MRYITMHRPYRCKYVLYIHYNYNYAVPESSDGEGDAVGDTPASVAAIPKRPLVSGWHTFNNQFP